MDWIDYKIGRPSNNQIVLGWDTVRNSPRVLTYRNGIWITESRLEIPYLQGTISHWAEVASPFAVA
jgi:hypothetical protein